MAKDGYTGGGIYGHGDYSPVVFNTILWANRGDQIYLKESGEISITYSNIQGGWEGEGNINIPPLFVHPYYGDYRLQADSPCINTGTPDDAPEIDLEGNLRDEFPDIGAYEYTGIAQPSVCDVSGDGTISAYDAALILQCCRSH